MIRELDPEGIPVPLLQIGVTDGRFFSRAGMQTYGFLPMRLPEDFAVHEADPRRRRADPGRRARVRGRGGVACGAEVPLRLLLLGGTKFLGRAVAEAALARGHELTLFNRGETNPELFPEAEKLRGNRDGDLSALAGREWDAVVDPSGFVPRVVGASAELLAGAVGHYVFVSSISVYAPPTEPGLDESAPVIELDDPGERGRTADYGGLKALCERAVEERFPGRATHVRAGSDRRPARPDRPVHVLGASAAPRRRDPGARAAGAPCAVRRRA